jgi:hypothetical protein
LVVTETGIDTRTPMGKAMAHMAVVLASWSVTSSAAVRVRGWPYAKNTASSSARQDQRPDDVVARVLRERTEGKTAYAIARDLNRDAVARPHAPGEFSACCVPPSSLVGFT